MKTEALTSAELNARVVPVAFTLPQCAAALGVPLWDVKELVANGLLGAIGIGTRMIVPRNELMRFLETQLVREQKQHRTTSVEQPA